jgi:large-conductance mechanosensitive channel
MVKIVYWSLLPKIGNFLAKGSTRCVNLGVGIICGAAQAVSVEIFTKDSVNEVLDFKIAADSCRD